MTEVSTLNSAKALHMDVRAVAPFEVIPKALILQAATRAGNLEGDEPSVRVPFINTDADAGFVDEGAVIPEGDPDTREVVIHTGKVAQLERVSREQYTTGDSAEMMDSSMRRAMTRKANRAFLSQPAPTGGDTNPPAGLLNLPITNGGTIGADLDEIAEAIMGIEEADGEATHIIAAPSAWAALLKLKTADDSNVSLVGAGVEAAQRSLLSVPVLVSNAAPANTLVILDKDAVLAVYGQLSLIKSGEFYLNRDSIGLLATWRFGIKVTYPERVVKLTIGSGGGS